MAIAGGDGGGMDPSPVDTSSAREYALKRLEEAEEPLKPITLSTEYACSGGHMRTVLKELVDTGEAERVAEGEYVDAETGDGSPQATDGSPQATAEGTDGTASDTAEATDTEPVEEPDSEMQEEYEEQWEDVDEGEATVGVDEAEEGGDEPEAEEIDEEPATTEVTVTEEEGVGSGWGLVIGTAALLAIVLLMQRGEDDSGSSTSEEEEESEEFETIDVESVWGES